MRKILDKAYCRLLLVEWVVPKMVTAPVQAGILYRGNKNIYYATPKAMNELEMILNEIDKPNTKEIIRGFIFNQEKGKYFLTLDA